MKRAGAAVAIGMLFCIGCESLRFAPNESAEAERLGA